MKIYEIPDFLNKKVRRCNWSAEWWIRFDRVRWLTDTNALSTGPDESDNWEEFKEKKKIILWRAIIKNETGYHTSNWCDSKDSMYHTTCTIVAWESREVEVNE